MKLKNVLFGMFLLTGTAAGISTVGAEDEYHMPKSDWLTALQNKLPGVLCAEGSFFRSCFEVSAAGCYEQAAASTSTCAEQFASRVPDPVTEEARWRKEIGTCAAMDYGSALQSKRINSDACSRPEDWFK